MDWHDYVTGYLVAERIAAHRAFAERQHLARVQWTPREPWRRFLGRGLIRLGAWLVATGSVAVHDPGH